MKIKIVLIKNINHILKMNLQDLPKDVLVEIVLNMDIKDVISLCKTSSIFNKKICQNDFFWINKLMKDYGIKEDVTDAKNEYLTIREILKTEPNRILRLGINSENFKLVKAALEHGADPEYGINFYYLFTRSIIFNDDAIFRYLLNKTINNKNATKIIANIFAFRNDGYFSKEERCRIFIRLISIVFPYVREFDDFREAKMLWDTAVNKIEELKDEDCISAEFYNKWINFYRELAK